MTALDVLRRLVEWETFMGGWDTRVWEDARQAVAGPAGEPLYRIPIEAALDWHSGKRSLREALHDVAWEYGDAGDFWDTHRLVVYVEGPDFLVYLKEEK